jgi:hypothetical protein
MVFFGLIAVINFMRVLRKKEKRHYFVAGMVSSLMGVAWILFVLGQILLMGILMAFIAVISIVAFPKTMKIMERESVKLAQEMDFSAPLRGRDFFTNQGWLKIASKWGLGKAMCLFYLLNMSILGGMLFVFSTFYGFMTREYTVVYAITFSIPFTLMFYRQFKKALKKREKD